MKNPFREVPIHHLKLFYAPRSSEQIESDIATDFQVCSLISVHHKRKSDTHSDLVSTQHHLSRRSRYSPSQHSYDDAMPVSDYEDNCEENGLDEKQVTNSCKSIGAERSNTWPLESSVSSSTSSSSFRTRRNKTMSTADDDLNDNNHHSTTSPLVFIDHDHNQDEIDSLHSLDIDDESKTEEVVFIASKRGVMTSCQGGTKQSELKRRKELLKQEQRQPLLKQSITLIDDEDKEDIEDQSIVCQSIVCSTSDVLLKSLDTTNNQTRENHIRTSLSSTATRTTRRSSSSYSLSISQSISSVAIEDYKQIPVARPIDFTLRTDKVLKEMLDHNVSTMKIIQYLKDKYGWKSEHYGRRVKWNEEFLAVSPFAIEIFFRPEICREHETDDDPIKLIVNYHYFTDVQLLRAYLVAVVNSNSRARFLYE
jgi:hypothetical protein